MVRLFNIAVQPATPPAVQPGATPVVQSGAGSSNQTIYPLPGVRLVSMATAGLLGVDAKTVKTFDQVLTGNEVMLFGHPSSLALQQLRQLDPSRPLLRKGIVAGTNVERKSIILDCPVYFGNSSGPVFEMDKDGLSTRFYAIGLVNQYVPFVQAGGSQTFAMQIESNSGVFHNNADGLRFGTDSVARKPVSLGYT